ncbi:2-oxo-4-hydroxy-4-carboxy-5-ureidoimidazoline decarboxylase [Roseibium hamelinense]|uniref:2-oxo-4-hydroxy-4-carboxy-5-ureidoimidazoline decarboxylase n=1 Tax=Roseibium hamelinense TaxID=150831 RepID=A0A562TH77_9HYPH|nr:2-oxo-4-hydroxy-4-carboxy-5-ureidoimidazoline decarboxylase [Roseibium hamelinense]MTI45821.1 2-oxo-4-hydroxy-4-carboxy-5-ureidoimidazoline decarboxylase [Roseibium hamelinense]TWI92997.1 2-oxo-4-hydroxy-4-carboxy-5-ureidoimidazoline decarboxylase [Roseibium hamelinense]
MHTVEQINCFKKDTFLQAFGDVAEHSPWVAERAFAALPYRNRDAVISAFEAAMQFASRDEQIALIRAHPDLAGKAARAGVVAEDSKKEQAGAGLDTLTDAEYARFTDLNDRYREKFGFPFIFAVKGATKHMILAAFEDRIEHTPDAEFAMALSQISRIFRFRLEERIAS